MKQYLIPLFFVLIKCSLLINKILKAVSHDIHCKSFCAKSGHSVGKFESRYLILCALHLARPLSECVIGMGKIGSYHYLCFANSYKIVKLCEGSAQNDGPDSFVCSLVIMSVDTTHSL